MKIEDQVCSLLLAKQLKELEVKQDSLWHWDIKYESIRIGKEQSEYGHDLRDYASAFTCAELGEVLPQYHETRDRMLTIVKDEHSNGRWWAGYSDADLSSEISAQARTLADVLAKLLCYLLENKLMTNQNKELT